MLKIPQQQVFERRDSLPENLREALCSDQNADILWKICEGQHIPEEKIYIIATLAGDVILGFIHIEDLAKEIRESLNLNPEIANSIAREIDRKIFSPIKSDLEKVYSPADSAFAAASAKEAALAEEGRPPEPQPSPKATAGEVKPAPFPIIPTVPEAQKVPTAQPKVPAEPLKTVLTTPVPADKPFILHQETEAESVAEKKKVTLPAIGWFKKAMPKTETPVKVELEIFGPKIEEKKEPTIAKTEAPKQKVVHYRETEVSTPFGKTQDEPLDKPEGPQPSPEATAGEAKVINLDSFE